MTIRIPSSINWLIKEHQRLNYDIADVEKELLKLRSVKSNLERELEAVERVIRRHEIPIDPSDIPTRKFFKTVSPFNYGELTTGIYKCLLSYPSYEGATCADITNFIISHLNLEFGSKADLSALREKVRKRLFNLTKKGTVVRSAGYKTQLYSLSYDGYLKASS